MVRLIKYLFSGGSAVAAEYGSFIVLLQVLSLPLVAANSMSYGVGLLVSFGLNRYWVFHEGKSKAVQHQFLQYMILVGINLVLTNLLLVGLDVAGIIPEIGKLLIIAATALWNFIIFKKIIFKNSDTI